MENGYREKLINKVLELSYSKVWEDAVLEWQIIGCMEDEACQSTCICGKEELRYLYTIKNMVTDEVLFPIGSSCIRKFAREDLSAMTDVISQMYKLYHAMERHEHIEMTGQYFSRKMLLAFYEEDIFEPNRFNNYDGGNDYRFLLEMFNRRREPTRAQQRKIGALIAYAIRPYLKQKLSAQKGIWQNTKTA